jgi:hypothetical protein
LVRQSHENISRGCLIGQHQKVRKHLHPEIRVVQILASNLVLYLADIHLAIYSIKKPFNMLLKGS